MRCQLSSCAILTALVRLGLALPAPTPLPTPTPVQNNANDLPERGIVGDALKDLDNLVQPTGSPSSNNNLNIIANLLTDFQLVTATLIPDGISAASRSLSNTINATPTPSNIVVLAGNLIGAGLTTDNGEDAIRFVAGLLDGDNSFNNFNPRNPFPAIYPKAGRQDAPYDLTEGELRAAIHIPEGFQYGCPGAPQPIILVPGTGDTGYTTFVGNLIPLLTGSIIADPVWLNIPGFLNGDAQVSAEYVAYAINYISAISEHRQIAVAAWSQGNIDTQWALKYWPSTRTKVTDLVAFSPDYHGTIFANFAATPGIPLVPSFFQQEYNSNFITTLRANGGDSGYVPTTNIYSGLFDEIVEPQQGMNASAYLLDARKVGVTNNEVQSICIGQPAGSFYTHEGTLYNPIGFALLKDALAHPGPGQVSRIDLNHICGDYLTPGLDLTDFLLTENTIAVAGASFLLYEPKTNFEPAIKAYAKLR